MSAVATFQVRPELEKQIDEIILHYPADQKRAAVLWLLHILQDEFGKLGREEVEWTAQKLRLEPINVWELVTFYPMFHEKPVGKYHIKVCRTLSCELCGAKKLLEHLQKKLGVSLDETTSDGKFTISTVECLAACGTAPVMMVNERLFENLTLEKVDEILATPDKNPQSPPILPPHPLEKRILLANITKPNYRGTLDDYVREGGYEALKKALKMKPEEVLAEVDVSGLRGRGGAAFPTGMKWKFLDRKSGKPIYLVCNADESEPGTFKDKQLIHYDPHMLIEGIVISCYATGAAAAYIYIRGEFTDGWKILARAIEEARAKNFVGKNILGSGFDCEIYVHRGAGAYICGEETGLIESLEGKRAYPRIKPPFPAVVGLFGCPTAVNNVETLCNVPHIIKNGGAWYKSLGVHGSTGTRILCVSGAVNRPGYYELELGKVTMRQLIYEICGGIRENRALKGVIPGGSSMPILTPDQIDVPLDFDSLKKVGTLAGSGGVIVLDETADIVRATLNVSQFYAHESCGQCTPCREGTLWMEKMLHRIEAGKGRPRDVDLLWEIADNIDGKTICPLGEAAAWPVKAFVTKYRKEFEAAVSGEKSKENHD
jgi:NADH-quinone oxidoreductase subunit F